jgi:hypothetical protein
MNNILINKEMSPVVKAINSCIDILIDNSVSNFGIWVLNDLNKNHLENIGCIAEKFALNKSFKLIIVSSFPIAWINSRFPFTSYNEIDIVKYNLIDLIISVNVLDNKLSEGISIKNDPFYWDIYYPHSICNSIHNMKSLPKGDNLTKNEIITVSIARHTELMKVQYLRARSGFIFPDDCESKWNSLLNMSQKIINNYSQEEYKKFRLFLYQSILSIESGIRNNYKVKKGDEPWRTKFY